MTRPLIYYITAHGYGHGVRSCDILRALCRFAPQLPLTLVTDLPASFLASRLPGLSYTLRRGRLDVGMVQRDSVRVDVHETLCLALDLVAERKTLVEQETTFLREVGAGLVVADIPSIPLESAACAGIPCVATGNFSWNWIYEPFLKQDARWQSVIDLFCEGYREADVLLRLPFSEPMTAFPRIVDIPVLAEPGTARCDEIARFTGAPRDRRWVLLSFSTLDWDVAALNKVESLEGYAFFSMRPLEWPGHRIYVVDREHISFGDLLASVDAVITKPGYGILSECVVNRKPMLYVDREDFREYGVLVASIQRWLQQAHIPAHDLYTGNLAPALETLWTAPRPVEAPLTGGATLAARAILDLLW